MLIWAEAAIFRASGLDLIRPPPWTSVAVAACFSWPLETSGRVGLLVISRYGALAPWASCLISGSGSTLLAGGAGAAAGAALAAPPEAPAIALGSSPLAARIRTGLPTATSWPIWAQRTATIPSSNDSSAMTALSVWTSASVSPSLTLSPTLTCHSTIWPLSIVGLIAPIGTSIGTRLFSLTNSG